MDTLGRHSGVRDLQAGNGSNLESSSPSYQPRTQVKENNMLADIFGPDLLIVAIVLVVLLFGGAAIPKLARNLGSAKNQFEKGLDEGKKADTTSAATNVDGTTTIVTTTPAPSAEEKAPGA
jgi:sec-independent protein translocase protein TatA